MDIMVKRAARSLFYFVAALAVTMLVGAALAYAWSAM